MTIRSSTKLPTVITQNGADRGYMFFEKGQNILVENMYSSYGQFVGVQATPGIAGMAV
jgi:hypothetical protein